MSLFTILNQILICIQLLEWDIKSINYVNFFRIVSMIFLMKFLCRAENMILDMNVFTLYSNRFLFTGDIFTYNSRNNRCRLISRGEVYLVAIQYRRTIGFFVFNHGLLLANHRRVDSQLSMDCTPYPPGVTRQFRKSSKISVPTCCFALESSDCINQNKSVNVLLWFSRLFSPSNSISRFLLGRVLIAGFFCYINRGHLFTFFHVLMSLIH